MNEPESVEVPSSPLVDRALVYAAAGVVYLSLRLLYLADGNPSVAMAMARDASPPELVVATLVWFGPMLLALGLPLYWRRQRAGSSLFTDPLGLAVLFLSALGLYIAPVFIALPCLLAAPLVLTRSARAKRRKRWRGLPGMGVLAVATSIMAVAVMAAPMHVPLERVAFKGHEPVLGYVLDSQDGFTPILPLEDGHLLYLPTSTISERSLCGSRRWFARSAWEIVYGNKLPKCRA